MKLECMKPSKTLEEKMKKDSGKKFTKIQKVKK